MYSQICSKMFFSVQNRINEIWNWMHHIWINLATSCILKQTISIAWTKFALKVYFPCNSLQRNKTITFSIFELVSVQSFILNNFVLGTNLLKKCIFAPKQKIWKKLHIVIEFNIFKLLCDHFHNMLRLFHVLPNFLFTTSESMSDYYL